MKATFTIDVEFDPAIISADALADALDHLMDTARSTPGVLDGCGDPRIGAFYPVTPATPSSEH